ATWSVMRRVHLGGGYSHTTMQATPLFPASSASDYASGTISVALASGQTLFTNTTWNRNVGGLATSRRTLRRRVDAGLSPQSGRRLANTLQLSIGSLADPLQLGSRGEQSIRDNATLAIPGGSINASVSHDRLSPSLVARLHQQLNLLAPGLQP